MRRRRGIMGLNGGAGIPVITATATGNPLTFETDLVRPLKSLVIPFTPIQAAGTPSPDNPLPISGWTDATINHYQINLLGSRISGTRFSTYIKKGTAVTASSNSTSGNQTVRFYNKNGTQVRYYYLQSYDAGREYRDYTTEQDIYSIDLPNTNPTVRRGTRQYIYDPTYADIIKILFVDANGDPLTVYGGTLTLNEDGSADLQPEYVLFQMDSNFGMPTSNITERNGYYYRRGTFASNLSGLPNRAITADWLCNKGQAATRLPAVGDTEAMYIYSTEAYYYVSIRADLLTEGTNEAFYNYLDSEKPIFCMHVDMAHATINIPQPYHFDNVGQLITFVGTNNIWTDTNGTNTATYLKHQS